MIPLEFEVVHFGVALVANAVEGVVGDGELSALIAARLAHGPPAPLAILLRVPIHHFQFAGEGRIAKLTRIFVFHAHRLEIESARERRLVEESIGCGGCGRLSERLRHGIAAG